MNRPLLRAEAIIFNEDKSQVLIQCDIDENFYRLPGGSIEFGETATEAIKRELIEEFDLDIYVGELACVNESLLEYDGMEVHHCTLIHWCAAPSVEHMTVITHKEEHNQNIILTWKTLEELSTRPTYPEGILHMISANSNIIEHLVIRKKY
ncbi:NUDIX domain-containing protein [Bacillus sp. PS06]|uniref:NUDIX domain-containing protein n=1 Tax=Bacillus sp. PS06 TaxID=2764176 RepID=UPI001CD824BA|nr:NUDIX domain-containing protein [Bacillus sp. PS06]